MDAYFAFTAFQHLLAQKSITSIGVMQPRPRWDMHLAMMPGYGYNKINTIEMNVGLSFSKRFSPLIYPSVFLGAGYEYGIEERIDAIKINFTIHSPVNIRLLPILFTDHTHWKFGFRPEIGLAIRKLTFSYGYTFVDKHLFEAVRGHRFGIRCLIPVWGIKNLPGNNYDF